MVRWQRINGRQRSKSIVDSQRLRLQDLRWLLETTAEGCLGLGGSQQGLCDLGKACLRSCDLNEGCLVMWPKLHMATTFTSPCNCDLDQQPFTEVAWLRSGSPRLAEGYTTKSHVIETRRGCGDPNWRPFVEVARLKSGLLRLIGGRTTKLWVATTHGGHGDPD